MNKMISQSKIKNIQYILLLILVLGVLSSRVESLRFELHSFHSKCIAEQIKKDGMTLGKYHIVNETEGHPLPDSHKVKVMVVKDIIPRTMSQEVLLGSMAGKRETILPASLHLMSSLQLSLQLTSNGSRVLWLRIGLMLPRKALLREKDARALNTATTSKMAWLSLLSLALCISVAGLQFWHLKSFFEKKKLI